MRTGGEWNPNPPTQSLDFRFDTGEGAVLTVPRERTDTPFHAWGALAEGTAEPILRFVLEDGAPVPDPPLCVQTLSPVDRSAVVDGPELSAWSFEVECEHGPPGVGTAHVHLGSVAAPPVASAQVLDWDADGWLCPDAHPHHACAREPLLDTDVDGFPDDLAGFPDDLAGVDTTDGIWPWTHCANASSGASLWPDRDDDGDGISDTQEWWWWTDPLNASDAPRCPAACRGSSGPQSRSSSSPPRSTAASAPPRARPTHRPSGGPTPRTMRCG